MKRIKLIALLTSLFFSSLVLASAKLSKEALDDMTYEDVQNIFVQENGLMSLVQGLDLLKQYESEDAKIRFVQKANSKSQLQIFAVTSLGLRGLSEDSTINEVLVH